MTLFETPEGPHLAYRYGLLRVSAGGCNTLLPVPRWRIAVMGVRCMLAAVWP